MLRALVAIYLLEVSNICLKYNIMKKFTSRLCLILLLFSVSVSYSQQSPLFDEAQLPALLKKATIANKPVFMMVYATWCPHCNKMKNEVFTNPEVITFFNKNYVATAVDGETESGKAIKDKYNVSSYPAFIFIDTKGITLYKLAGEYTAQQVINEAQNALVTKNQLPYVEQQFNADPANSDKCLAYITTLLKGKNRKELSAPTHKYLATQTDDQLLSETNWRIIANGVSDINSREFQYVLKNKNKFDKLISPTRVDRKIDNIVTEYLKQFFEKPDIDVYAKKREVVKAIDLQSTNELLFKNDLQMAEVTEDWNFYKQITREHAPQIADQSLLKDIAMNYLDHYSDVSTLEKAAKWLEASLETTDAYDGEILVAKIYSKSGNKAKAKEAALKAKKLATNLGWDAKEAEEILSSL